MRGVASGSSIPVGFKNAENGDVGPAVNSIVVASKPGCFKGANDDDLVARISTTDNPFTHLVLRGGEQYGVKRPNYGIEDIRTALQKLRVKKAR